MRSLHPLGKSKLARALLISLFLVAPGQDFSEEPAHAQARYTKSQKLEEQFIPRKSEEPIKYEILRTEKPFDKRKYIPLREFEELGIKLDDIDPNRLYRDDGIVSSSSEHFLRLMREFGYRAKVKKEFKDAIYELKGKDDEYQGMHYFKEQVGDALAGSFFPHAKDNGEEYEIAIVFCTPQDDSPSWRTFFLSHEQLHITQRHKINQVYHILKKRLEKYGYCIPFSKFDGEEQADIAGITAVMENGFSLEPVLRRCKNAREVYRKMQDYRTDRKFSAFELYKPAHANR